MMKRPDIPAKEWRQKVDSGEIVLPKSPSRNPYVESTLLKRGKWLQKQGEEYFLFDCYSHNYEELTIDQVVDMLVDELSNLNRKYNGHQSERGRDA